MLASHVNPLVPHVVFQWTWNIHIILDGKGSWPNSPLSLIVFMIHRFILESQLHIELNIIQIHNSILWDWQYFTDFSNIFLTFIMLWRYGEYSLYVSTTFDKIQWLQISSFQLGLASENVYLCGFGWHNGWRSSLNGHFQYLSIHSSRMWEFDFHMYVLEMV